MSQASDAMSHSYAVIGVILPRWTGIQTVLGTHFMSFSQVTKHLHARGELLLSSQFDRIISDYCYPLPVFLQSSRLLVSTPDHAWLVLSHLRDALVARGVVALRPRVSAIDLPRAGRFRVWVDWHEIAFPVEETRISQAIYYCRDTGFGLQTEMVNYTHLSMPELNRQFSEIALSA
jgi:hypothetical protein